MQQRSSARWGHTSTVKSLDVKQISKLKSMNTTFSSLLLQIYERIFRFARAIFLVGPYKER